MVPRKKSAPEDQKIAVEKTEVFSSQIVGKLPYWFFARKICGSPRAILSPMAARGLVAIGRKTS